MKSKTVLVTGGAGFIGSHLVERLVKDECRVIVVDDFNDYYDPEIKRANTKNFQNVTVIKADITDTKALDKIFKDYPIDTIVHLAARAGVRPSLLNPKLYWQVNVLGSINLLELAREFKVEKFIAASSSSVYGERSGEAFVETDNTDIPISPYGASKRAMEIACLNYAKVWDLDTTCLRFFTAFGPRNRPDMAMFKLVDAAMTGKPFTVFGQGETGRDYTFVSDIIDGIMKSLEMPNLKGEIINLGNSHPVKLMDLINKIETLTDKKLNINYAPLSRGDVSFTYANIDKAKKLLNWLPKYSLDEGLKELVNWYTHK